MCMPFIQLATAKYPPCLLLMQGFTDAIVDLSLELVTTNPKPTTPSFSDISRFFLFLKVCSSSLCFLVNVLSIA